MTRDEKVQEMYRHLMSVMAPGPAAAASMYLMKIIESWETRTEEVSPSVEVGKKPKRIEPKE